MTLPASPAQLTMAQIGTEFFTTARDVASFRGLTRGIATTELEFADFHGKNGFATVTVGYLDEGFWDTWGYEFVVQGSIATPIFPGAGDTTTITTMIWMSTDILELRLSSGRVSNDDTTFKTLRVGSTSFARSSASSYSSGSGSGIWQWSGVTTNPIGTSGTKAIALWTK